ncbi:hypothetical protein LCGC14_1744540 [marine sediment metagenome]|uniref:Glycosyl transferase family 3 N-terminal domain-containing protein n=1 Tax=marine sediment metagenome TaxID=412755 RepID=A0A0F9K591_9ZZZZ
MTRSLPLEEAEEAMSMILRGEVLPEQLGAFLMLLRVKEESPEEIAGFVRAGRNLFDLPSPAPEVDIDWSSYAGKRRQLPWFLLAALLLGGASMISLLFRRGQDRPLLLFVGWRRIGRICLLAVVLPLAVYTVYTFTGRDRIYGMGYVMDKAVLAFVVLIAAVYLLLIRLSYSAVRRRAIELGLDVPPAIGLRDRKWTVGIGAVIALAAAVYLLGWWAGVFEPKQWNRLDYFVPGLYSVPGLDYSGPGPDYFGPGVILACVVVGFLLACKVREYFGVTYRKRYKPFRRALRRSLVPILAAATILIGVSCGWVLARGERSAVRRMKGNAVVSLSREVDRCDYRLLRDRMARQHKQMLAKGRHGQ